MWEDCMILKCFGNISELLFQEFSVSNLSWQQGSVIQHWLYYFSHENCFWKDDSVHSNFYLHPSLSLLLLSNFPWWMMWFTGSFLVLFSLVWLCVMWTSDFIQLYTWLEPIYFCILSLLKLSCLVQCVQTADVNTVWRWQNHLFLNPYSI